MVANRVDVRITGTDELSGMVRGLRGGIVSNIGTAVASIAALSVGLLAAGIAFSNLGSGLGKAMQMQTMDITNAYGLVNIMGSTVADAKRVTKELNLEMIALGDTLPGVTENYQEMGNAISDTVARGAGGQISKYKADMVELAKTGALLVATSVGVNGSQGASAFNKFLSGGMSKEEAFNTTDIFQKNQGFKQTLTKAQEDLGLAGKDFRKDLTNAQRSAIVQLAGTMRFTPAMLAEYGQTAETQLSALQSKLFNPISGVFGFGRTIKNLNGRSALDAVTGLLVQVDTMSGTAGKWLAANGINLDPMEAIGHMMDAAADWAAAFDALMRGDKSGVMVLIGNLKRGMGAIKVEDIMKAINGAMGLISSAISAVDWSGYGKHLSDIMARALMGFDWNKAGEVLDNAYFAVINALASFIKASAGHLNRTISRAMGYDDSRITPAQRKAIAANDAVKGQFWDNIRGVNKPDPKGKDGKDFNSSQSSLPALEKMSGNSKSSVFSPQINITGGSADSMQQTADYILTAINNQYMQYRDAALV